MCKNKKVITLLWILLLEDSYRFFKRPSPKNIKENIFFSLLLQTDWLNGVLQHCQQYFSHIMETAHINHVFPGFCQY